MKQFINQKLHFEYSFTDEDFTKAKRDFISKIT